MYNTILNSLRLTILGVMIFLGVVFGSPETSNCETPHNTICQEPTTAATEAPEPTETETPTEPTTTETEPPAAAEPTTEQNTPQTQPTPTESWQSLGTYRLTAYCPCKKCCGRWAENRPIDENGNTIVYTASGAIAQAGTTIAVDPSIIPYGSKVKINGHIYTAQDCGGAIKGNRIDIYYLDHSSALEHGVQMAEVFVFVDAA